MHPFAFWDRSEKWVAVFLVRKMSNTRENSYGRPSCQGACVAATMVLKTEVCRFSGLKIYPGHGMRLTKTDSQTFLFLNAKCKRLFNLRLRPAKLAWTTQYRKAHKKVRARSRVLDVA